MGVSQNEGYLCGVPIIRVIVVLGSVLYWGGPLLGNYHIYIYVYILYWGPGYFLRGPHACIYLYVYPRGAQGNPILLGRITLVLPQSQFCIASETAGMQNLDVLSA